MPENTSKANITILAVSFVIIFSISMVLFNLWVKQSLKEESLPSQQQTKVQASSVFLQGEEKSAEPKATKLPETSKPIQPSPTMKKPVRSNERFAG